MELEMELLYEVEKTLDHITALKAISAQQLQAERRLKGELESLFSDTFDSVLNSLLDMRVVPASAEQRRELLMQLEDVRDDLHDVMGQEAELTSQYGRNRTLSDLQRMGVSVGFDAVPDRILQLIKGSAFVAADSTLDRMIGDVMGNLTESYELGLGIEQAAERLDAMFQGMKTWQLERIARTEINRYQNMAAHETMQELGVEYEIWHTAQDERVRGDPAGEYPDAEFDHSEMHGQIVRTGDNFVHPEQGWELAYPADPDGELANIINCRCRSRPFLMPEGKRAPDADYFYEEDLVDA